jgi:Xaa-Pro aminopeptidase
VTPASTPTPSPRPAGVRRREALRAALRDAGLDALLVTDLVNVRYLAGFTGSNAALLVHAADGPGDEGRTVLATDGRYTVQAAAETPDLPLLVERACAPALLGTTGAAAIGFDSAQVTVDALDTLTAATGADLRRAPGLVERLRAVKDDAEVDALRLGCAAADAALAGAIADGVLAPGRTEREVARELEERMVAHGASGPAFETIVAAGAHSAIPHHSPTDAPLAAGDLVTMDFGALVDGYHSDMTRTVLVGPGTAVADWEREVYALVDAAAAAGRAALRPGVGTREIDAAARDVIAAAGYGEYFVHPVGHGVGLVIHEAPAMGSTATATLAEGMTVTVEPGVYLPGRGGVRIEDTLVVTGSGAEPLTASTRDLLVLG